MDGTAGTAGQQPSPLERLYGPTGLAEKAVHGAVIPSNDQIGAWAKPVKAGMVPTRPTGTDLAPLSNGSLYGPTG
jgi:hypothetical protein